MHLQATMAGLALWLAAGAALADNLYHPNTYVSLTSDRRASRPGDSITILVYENSSASSSAATTMQRHNDVAARVDGGKDGAGHRAGGALSLDNGFNGGGTVQRSGKLLAQITATVVAVADNGELLVRGDQLLEVNADRQQIRVEGRVRPRDVGPGNTVLSNRLAEARISYLGDGDLSKRQKPGWLSRVLVWMGL